MLRLDLCDFSDAYIVVEGTVTLNGELHFKDKWCINQQRRGSWGFNANAQFDWVQ